MPVIKNVTSTPSGIDLQNMINTLGRYLSCAQDLCILVMQQHVKRRSSQHLTGYTVTIGDSLRSKQPHGPWLAVLYCVRAAFVSDLRDSSVFHFSCRKGVICDYVVANSILAILFCVLEVWA